MLKSKNEPKSDRTAITKDVATALVQQFSSLIGKDLHGYTYEQRPSSQPGAKSDISVYDASGALCYEGRKFGGSQGISFWKPASV